MGVFLAAASGSTACGSATWRPSRPKVSCRGDHSRADNYAPFCAVDVAGIFRGGKSRGVPKFEAGNLQWGNVTKEVGGEILREAEGRAPQFVWADGIVD